MPDLTAIRSADHADALRERDRFLSEHPELKDLQRRIDRMLGNAQSHHNRLVLINRLMMDSLRKLDERLQDIARAGRQRSSRDKGSPC